MQQPSKLNIFILTCSRDRTAPMVAEKLADHGHAPIIYEADKVFSGEKPFDFQLEPTGKTRVAYGDVTFDPLEIDAAWVRWVHSVAPGQIKDKFREMQINLFLRRFHANMFGTIPETVWLNSPLALERADRKIPQARLAASVGLTIPTTVITNKWSSITKMPEKKVAKKMPFNCLQSIKKKPVIFYTTALDNDATTLPTQASPYPGYWQPFIPKAREWRVIVVGNKVFSAAIYTTKSAKNDWREHQNDAKKVKFVSEKFPEEEAKKCKALLKKLGLRYGAFDFVETPEGKIVFLEVNSNGQYGWLEQDAGLPVSAAIADELIRIAKHSYAKREVA